MVLRSWLLFSLFALALLCCGLTSAFAGHEDMAGVIVGRTGELIHISLPQPVKEGAVVSVKPFEANPAIAEARVVSCTNERPFLALAKVVKADLDSEVAIGVRCYVDSSQTTGAETPKPMRHSAPDKDRFSLQAGAFYPTNTALRESTSDVWQAYRFNYSLLKATTFDAVLSAEYLKGSNSDSAISRSMEVIPMTVMGRFRPLRMGSVSFFLGAGAGAYSIRSSTDDGNGSSSDDTTKFGTEYTAGFESTKGWILEARYRDVDDTSIRGYSLGLGARF